MKKKVVKNKKQNRQKFDNATVAYRLKCAKTGNGLSHFVMYGDAPKDQSPV